MQRILIIGNTGSGKTTLAQRLMAQLNIPHVELDALNWEADWQAVSSEEFLERVSTATQDGAWIVDGNYTSKLGDTLFLKADTIVWLDYPLRVNFWRLLKRSSSRVFLRTRIFNGNREHLLHWFIPGESLFLWLFKTHRQKRERYLAMMEREDLAHVRWVHIRSKRDYEAFLREIEAEQV